jgi:asparagine synthase (glutamine-hydrolysing)
MVSQWREPALLVGSIEEPTTLLTDRAAWPQVSDFMSRMMSMDLVTYLPDDLLVKVDRASMSVSLEVRVPFLDHRIIEWAWRLPLSMKVGEEVGKRLLRRVLGA